MNPLQFNLRAKVGYLLSKVQEGESLSKLLDDQLNNITEKDRALFHQLVLGTLRYWYNIKAASLPLLKKDLNNPYVEGLIYLGIYQLIFTRIPPHASISETVTAVKQLGFSPLSGVVNAVLRKVSRDQENFKQIIVNAHGLPSWLYKRLKRDWPEQIQDLCLALKEHAPLTIRVNQKQTTRNNYLALLEENHIEAKKCNFSQSGLQIFSAIPVTQLPGFKEGLFFVQDENAQLASEIFDKKLDGKTIIDACAAPGGKTTHILEKFKVNKLIALDNNENRIQRIQENLYRLKLNNSNIELINSDATTWQSKENIDIILLDAPCSATGVIRRHPDIQLLRKMSDITQTVELQEKILNNMWNQLSIGGYLLYITCSILKIENENQMKKFFSNHIDAKEIPINNHWGIKQKFGRQLLPVDQFGDGFYYCLIQKVI